MKNAGVRLLLFVVCLAFAGILQAQTGKVPPFRMMQADGRVFRAEYLPVGKPIVLIYFSPDCEECHKLTTALLARINEFRDVSIAMITYQQVNLMSDYVKQNNLLSYSNIYIGTEYPTLNVRNYYNIMRFPFVALYNKNGDLIRKYTDREINLDDLKSRIAGLK